MTIRRRTLIQSLSFAWFTGFGARLSAVDRSTRLNVVTHNVQDFGAIGDGITDDTAAFNRATNASAAWSVALEYAVFVPSGRYRIAGTVFVRKGQTLYGEGLSTHIDATHAKGSTFVLGKRLVSGTTMDDPGGSPVKIANLRGLGGAPDHGFIYTSVAGFQVTGLFLSATGIGIEIEAADGIMSDIAIDGCLNGIVFRNCQNIVANNINIYLPNYAISFMGECRDLLFSNTLVTYTKYASILFGDAVENIDNVVFSNCSFVNNVQYDTFSGYIYSRASRVSAMFRACSFRNWPRYAINQDAGVDVSLAFDACVFDGAPTNPVYNKSNSARCISTGMGRYRFTDCSFQNLHGEIATVNGRLQLLSITGGNISNCATGRMKFASTLTGKIVIRDVQGFASVSRGKGFQSISLPWWGAGTIWRLQIAGGDSEARELVIAVSRTATDATPVAEIVTTWTSRARSTEWPAASRPTVSLARLEAANGRVVIDMPIAGLESTEWTVDAETVG
jgi:Pectate lyase superfamily protein